MKKVQSFKDLILWKEAHELVLTVNKNKRSPLINFLYPYLCQGEIHRV